MRLSFFIALCLLTFVELNNGLAYADKSVKEEMKHAVRTPNEATKGNKRSASAVEDRAARNQEERAGNPQALQKLSSFTQGAGVLHNQAAISNTVGHLSKSHSFNNLKKSFDGHPKAIKTLNSLKKSFSQKSFKTPEDEAVALAAAARSPDVMSVAKSIHENPQALKEISEVAQNPAVKNVVQSVSRVDKRGPLSKTQKKVIKAIAIVITVLAVVGIFGMLFHSGLENAKATSSAA